MKYALLLFILSITLACNSKKENNTQPETTTEIEDPAEEPRSYPVAFEKILEAHGGLDNWKSYKTLQFTIDKSPNTDETHTIDLQTRKDQIQMGTASMGFDGSQAWLTDPEETYKGNPNFYHNLMFYFYAMPFVLADEGIIYDATTDLVVKDVAYPGFKISFEANVGSSSNDEYYLYYDSETYKMRWLGYTATFGAEEKSDAVNYIAYDNWTNVEDVLLPQSISWYVVEDDLLTEPRNTVSFKNSSLSIEAKPDTFYSKK